MKNSTVTAALLAMRDLLQTRPNLAGVVVSTVPLDDKSQVQESLEFASLEQTQDYGAIGARRKEEEYTVHGWIIIVRYGAGEQPGIDARERAYTLLSELDDCLTENPTLGGLVKTATLTAHRLMQFITGDTGNQRGATIDFDISVKATLTRS